MWKPQSNKFNSYEGIRAMLETNKALYEDNKLAMDLVNEFFSLMDEISDMATQSDNKTNSLTKTKKEMKDRMANRTVAMASAGALYAMDTKDAELYSELNLSYSKIMYAKDADALRRATGIESSLRSLVGQLDGYMVSLKDLDELKIAIDQFNELYQLQINVKNNAHASKILLQNLFQKMDKFLGEKLDRMMRRIKLDHTDFADHYFQARKIYDR